MKLKKITAAAVAAAMLAVSAPLAITLNNAVSVTASAAETEIETKTEGDWEYEVNEDGESVTITKYTGSDTEVDIPGSLGGKTVTTIDFVAFINCELLTSITIPDSVTTIGDCAFQGCTSLTSVTIPNSVTKIDWYAFRGCTSLTSVIIPDSVTTIEEGAFDGCTSLERITVGENNPNYSLVNGVLFNKDKSEIICYPAGKKDKSYIIPDGVTSIGSAFYGCTSLTSVTIPNSVTSIYFSGCTSLTSVTIPDSVTRIGDNAFEGCTSLTSVKIPDNVTEIGSYAFEGCTSLTSVTIPDSVTEMDWGVFRNCTSLSSVTIPDSVTKIYNSVFYDCTSLERITVGENNPSYSSVDGVLFNKDKSVLVCYPAGKKDKSYTIPDSVTTIEYCALENTALTSVMIPEGFTDYERLRDIPNLTEIKVDPENAEYLSENGVLFNKDKTELIFYPCGKNDKYYIVPDGVTSIGPAAMCRNDYLVSVILPDSVNTIGNGAFNCRNLKWVFIPESVTTIGWYVFTDAPQKSDVSYGNDGIADIFYGGSKESWEKIKLTENYYFKPTMHYNCVSVNVTDKATEINAAGIFSADVKFSVKSAEDLTNDTQYAYELAFTKEDGKEVQPESEVVIKVPVPEAFKDKTYYVYQVMDGENVSVDFTVEDSMIVFSAENIKNFTISGKKLLEEAGTGDEPETSEPTTSDTSEPTSSDTSEPTSSDTSEPTSNDTSDPTDPDSYDKKYDITTDVEPSPDAAGIPDDERVKSVTINAANWINKGEINLDEVKVKVREIYDEEGLKRAEEALGKILDGNKYNLLDLTLLYNGEDYSNGYEGLIQVKFKIPNGHKNKTISCYRITEVDGKPVKELIPGTQTEDYYIIYLEHFSLYALVADANPDDGEEQPSESKDSETSTPIIPGDTDKNSGGNSGNDQANTGIALAAAPVILACATVIAASKKKK